MCCCAKAALLSSTIPLPARYTGRLTHKRILAPLERVTIDAKLWISRPGVYALDGWTVETEVGEVLDASSSTSESLPENPVTGAQKVEEGQEGRWRTRQRYQQGPPAGGLSSFTVIDIAQT